MSEREGLGRTAARGAAVTVAAQIARMALQLISVVTLARLLTPSDFGIVAIGLLVVGFGELFRDFGLSQAAVQAPELSTDTRTNLFWINAAFGVGLAVLCYLAAWPVAAVTDAPEVIGVCHALALTFVFNALAAQYRAGLMRQLRFTALSLLEVVAAAAGLTVAIAGAVAGIGYWALVAQQLTTIIVTLIALVAMGRWLPGLPNRRGDVRSFLSFGWNLVASQVVAYIASNVDTAIVGTRYSTATLGLYNRAFQLVVVPVGQIRAPLTNVALPVLSRLRDSDVEFNRFVVRAQLVMGYALCLALGFVAVAADPIVRVLLGPDWGDSTFFLRCFSAAAMFQTLAFVGFWVYLSRALTHVLFRYSMVSAAIKISCVVIGAFWGPTGIAIGFAVAPALSWPISLWWLSRHAPIRLGMLYAGAGRILGMTAVGIAVAVPVVLWTSFPPLAELALLAVAYAAGLLILLSIPRYRKDAADIIATMKLVRSGRGGATPA